MARRKGNVLKICIGCILTFLTFLLLDYVLESKNISHDSKVTEDTFKDPKFLNKDKEDETNVLKINSISTTARKAENSLVKELETPETMKKILLEKNSPIIKNNNMVSNQRPLIQKQQNREEKSVKISPKKKHSTHIKMLEVCPASIYDMYRKPSPTSDSGDMKWCQDTKQHYGVQVGRSWGSLSGAMREAWETRRCNDIISSGGILPCDKRWGWGMFESWSHKSTLIVDGFSTVRCEANHLSSTYCRLTNAVVDFSKAHIQGKQRSFDRGFVTTYGTTVSREGMGVIAGFENVNTLSKTEMTPQDMRCDRVEERPTFFISHDDIFNLGHHINDVVAVWAMTVLAGRATSESLLVTMDGLREGGPAGGPAHRLMLAEDPDAWGPYFGYYSSWFGSNTKRAIEYGRSRICFREVYFQPYPGIGWFWNNWGHIDECSVQAASPLYQSFSVFLRQRWEEEFGPGSLPPPPTDVVKIIIEARSVNKSKRNNHSLARHIVNLDELVAALATIPGVTVKAQDFAKLSFDKQVALAHSTGVLLSMHGAGTTHLFHMAVGRPNCCALVELQPEASVGFQSAVGFGNLARMHGMKYFRHLSKDGTLGSKGTTVDVEAILELTRKAVEAVRTKPSCLLDAQDTTTPVFTQKDVFQSSKS